MHLQKNASQQWSEYGNSWWCTTEHNQEVVLYKHTHGHQFTRVLHNYICLGLLVDRNFFLVGTHIFEAPWLAWLLQLSLSHDETGLNLCSNQLSSFSRILACETNKPYIGFLKNAQLV